MSNNLIHSQNLQRKPFPFAELPSKAHSKILGTCTAPQLSTISRISKLLNVLTEPYLRLAHQSLVIRPLRNMKLSLLSALPPQDVLERTPLHNAVLKNQPALVLALLAEGADPNAKDWRGCSPFYYALDHWKLDPFIIASLLCAGAHPLTEDKSQNTPLRKAIERTYNSDRKKALNPLILEMIERCSEKLTVKNGEDETLLFTACQAENTQVASALMKKGIDPAVPNHSGETALTQLLDSFGVLLGDKEMLELMYQMLVKAPSLSNTLNRNGDTAAHIACDLVDQKILRLLFDNKANFSAINKKGLTPISILLNKADAVSYLVSLDLKTRRFACAFAWIVMDREKSDWNTKNDRGRTLLHLAVQLSLSTLVAYLVKRADPCIEDHSGKTPLEYSHDDEISSWLVNCDLTIINEMVICRYIDNLFALGGTWKSGKWTFSGEGYTTLSTARVFTQTINGFFSSEILKKLKEEYPQLQNIDFTEVQKALNRVPDNLSKDAEELATAIKGGLSEPLLTTWTFREDGHAAGIVYLGEHLLAKCERGGHPGAKTGIEFYTITKPDKIKESIELLRKQGQEEGGWAYFTTGINETLGLVAQEEKYIPLSKQKSGNCPMASIHGILRVLLTSTIPDPKLARIVSKAAVLFELEVALGIGLIQEPKNIPLLRAVYHKINNTPEGHRLAGLKTSPVYEGLCALIEAADRSAPSEELT